MDGVLHLFQRQSSLAVPALSQPLTPYSQNGPKLMDHRERTTLPRGASSGIKEQALGFSTQEDPSMAAQGGGQQQSASLQDQHCLTGHV